MIAARTLPHVQQRQSSVRPVQWAHNPMSTEGVGGLTKPSLNVIRSQTRPTRARLHWTICGSTVPRPLTTQTPGTLRTWVKWPPRQKHGCASHQSRGYVPHSYDLPISACLPACLPGYGQELCVLVACCSDRTPHVCMYVRTLT
jgi:hypothetical protein